MIARRLLLALFLALTAAPLAAQTPRWQTLPPTPTLPAATKSGLAPVNGVRIWYATFGKGQPVILLHGGLANANYWGHQVRDLARRYQVIVMDSRGHGRSTRDARPFGYNLMADDVIGLMDFLKLPRAAIVGWSDGGILGIDLAMRYPARITKVFAFAANTDPSGVVEGVEKNPTFARFIERAGEEYKKLSATPTQYDAFVEAISGMWASEPNWTEAQLKAIRVPIQVVDGDHDEAIKRPHTERMAELIPGAGLLIQPNVSHFSMLQDPAQFTQDVMHFLALKP
jgi:pimeloyl-ACP methyl ester carboxylesterase